MKQKLMATLRCKEKSDSIETDHKNHISDFLEPCNCAIARAIRIKTNLRAILITENNITIFGLDERNMIFGYESWVKNEHMAHL